MSEYLETSEFFAPVSADVVDGLIGYHEQAKRRIHQVHQFVTGEEYTDAVSYFLNADEDHRMRYSRQVSEVFDLDRAIKYLDSVYWQRALDQTDVYQCMPQARKDEWNESIRKRDTPPFDEDTVRATLEDLLLSRKKFIAEKVDGVFRRLSGEHVTNRPEGFFKRFIMGYCFGYGFADHSSGGYLDDLRSVIAMFTGRDQTSMNLSTQAMNYARNKMRGQWVSIDGGALRIRCYLKGTMHIEVHPDMAWRLNCLLHELYPAAIPSSKRKAPKRKANIPPVHDRPLPFAVLSVLAEGRITKNEWAKSYADNTNKAALKEAGNVLAAIGGTAIDGDWHFDYDPTDIISEICASGVIPDKVSHQFYPTPYDIAEAAIAAAEITSDHDCLEPSAGLGALWMRMPEWAEAVEISELHCTVLNQLRPGGNVHSADFLAWRPDQQYDRIVMNPPYSQGRALAHLEHALTMLKPGGRLVAILPASYRSRELPGNGRWGETFDNAFQGTSISVSIYIVDAP